MGALGIVLFDQTSSNLQPLLAKFARLQQDLEEAQLELAAQRSQQGDGRRQSKYTLASFIGASPAASEVKRQARRAAQSHSPVLLLGETGTGKELLAHGIHAASPRAARRAALRQRQHRRRARHPALIGALLVGLMANYTGFLAPKVALFSNIALMVAILLWRPQGVYPVVNR